MNELHDYPLEWDKVDITELPEYQGLLTKNVEALFTSKGVDDGFLAFLGEKQIDSLGTDVITTLVMLLKESRPERISKDPHYALLLSEQLTELREVMKEVAAEHVAVATEQELEENRREALSEREIEEYEARRIA